MTRISAKLSDLPKLIQQPASQLAKVRLARPWEGIKTQRHYPIDLIGEVRVFDQAEIGQAEITWLSANIESCTIAAAIKFSSKNNIEQACVGHFSANDVHIRLPEMLKQYEPANSVFYFAGMSGRSSRKTLNRTCQFLRQTLNEQGWPLMFGWQMKDRPEFVRLNGSSYSTISDIGMGLPSSDRRLRGIYRRVLVAVTGKELALFSLTYSKQFNADSVPFDSLLFLSGLGKMSLDLD